MVRIALLAGSHPIALELPANGTALPPPAPTGELIVDITAAVRDALRFPLAGTPLADLARRKRSATIVVEPPALPVPGGLRDPRLEALVATSDELEAAGIPSRQQTILVAAGLARKPGRRELSALVTPEFRRRFRGVVTVHDVEAPDLVPLAEAGAAPIFVARELAETDLVVTLSAAESVLHGGPNLLLAAGAAEPLQAAQDSPSLLETGGSRGWRLALAAERALARKVPLFGVSLAFAPPRFGGWASGYPYDARALGRIAHSNLRRALALVPRALRWRMLVAAPVEIAATAAFAGPPSVAHAEALLATLATRTTDIEGEFDVLCIPVPDTTLMLPRERPNPLAAAAFGLGYAYRRWRDRPPLSQGGAIVLVHGFERYFAHPGQQPYRAFFSAARYGRDPETLAQAAREARTDARAVAFYRQGQGCHPLLPFADWDSCRPAIDRAGTIVVAGCHDSVSARQLGFIPSHGIGHALELAAGAVGESARIGFMLGPPYAALRPANGADTAPEISA
ncbi:MAG: lactate racemase domain-containing protein [Gaiellaceae bacterium]